MKKVKRKYGNSFENLKKLFNFNIIFILSSNINL